MPALPANPPFEIIVDRCCPEHKRGCVTTFLQERSSLRSAKPGESRTIIRGNQLPTEDGQLIGAVTFYAPAATPALAPTSEHFAGGNPLTTLPPMNLWYESHQFRQNSLIYTSWRSKLMFSGLSDLVAQDHGSWLISGKIMV